MWANSRSCLLTLANQVQCLWHHQPFIQKSPPPAAPSPCLSLHSSSVHHTKKFKNWALYMHCAAFWVLRICLCNLFKLYKIKNLGKRFYSFWTFKNQFMSRPLLPCLCGVYWFRLSRNVYDGNRAFAPILRQSRWSLLYDVYWLIWWCWTGNEIEIPEHSSGSEFHFSLLNNEQRIKRKNRWRMKSNNKTNK
jgi:hypothetical protein